MAWAGVEGSAQTVGHADVNVNQLHHWVIPRTHGEGIVHNVGMTEDTEALMGIAEMCAAFEVSPRTLRFYETKGLLAPRRLNGTRVYSKVDRARLSRILRAKSLGMPLSEVKVYLDMYGDQGEGRVQQLTYVIETTDAAIRDLEAKRAEIDTSLAELRLINERSRQMLDSKRSSKAKPR